MEINEIIKDVPEEKIAEFKRLAKDSWNADQLSMLDYMLAGCTPYQSARKRKESGLTDLSIHTLFYHAKTVQSALLEHFGMRVEQWMEQLQRDGEIVGIPSAQIPALKKLAEDLSLQIEVTTRVTLLDPELDISTKVE